LRRRRHDCWLERNEFLRNKFVGRLARRSASRRELEQANEPNMHRVLFIKVASSVESVPKRTLRAWDTAFGKFCDESLTQLNVRVMFYFDISGFCSWRPFPSTLRPA
jgi:hypothetical protein